MLVTMMDPKEAAQKELNGPGLSLGDRYRHYKGGEYEIVAAAIQEDTLVSVVVYRSIEHGTVWVRTLKNWNEEVEFNGTRVKRFRRI